jgi:hypothetical protein
MKASTVIALRKELKYLPGQGKPRSDGARLPIRIVGPNTNYAFSEADCCFIWDDDNEVVYIVMPNTVHTQTLDSRSYPMSILAMEYDAIQFMSTVCARNELDYFLSTKESDSLVGSETRKRYFQDLTDLNDPRSYAMGMPSPTTEKRDLEPGDEVINPDVNFC